MRNRHYLLTLCLLLIGALAPVGHPAMAADGVLVSTLDVSVTSGAADLPAGAVLELKIYEQSPVPRIVALTHGEAWPAAASRLVRVHLERPLDPRRVRRFSLAYRAPRPGLPAWDVESARVEWDANGERQRLLATTLAGVVAVDRELASEEVREAQLLCATDADCDNGRSCDGVERCEPANRRADPRGCVSGKPVICPVNQVCVEHQGCRGISEAGSSVRQVPH